MKLPEINAGVALSVVGHTGLLLWGLVSFSARPLEARPSDALPVDIITSEQFSRMTQGVKNAPKPEPAKPLVDKVAPPKPVEEVTPKVADKPEIKPTAEPAPAPPPAEARPADKKELRFDEIAETLKRERAKRQAEAKAKEEKKKLEAQKFDPKRIESTLAALLDKRTPQRSAATGGEVNRTAGLGTPAGNAPQLTADEMSLLSDKLEKCWTVPAGVRDADKLEVPITIRLKPDGYLASPPQPEIRATDPQMQAMIESTIRAFNSCQPYTMLRPSNYESWKVLPFMFSPKKMFGR